MKVLRGFFVGSTGSSSRRVYTRSPPARATTDGASVASGINPVRGTSPKPRRTKALRGFFCGLNRELNPQGSHEEPRRSGRRSALIIPSSRVRRRGRERDTSAAQRSPSGDSGVGPVTAWARDSADKSSLGTDFPWTRIPASRRFSFKTGSFCRYRYHVP